MAVIDTTKQEVIDTGLDNITIVKFLEDIPGGRTLLVAAADKEKVFRAGHIILAKGKEFVPAAVIDALAGSVKALSYKALAGGDGVFAEMQLEAQSTSGAGTGLIIKAQRTGAGIPVKVTEIVNAGSGYAAGDTVTFPSGGIADATFTVNVDAVNAGGVKYDTSGGKPVGVLYKSVTGEKPLASIMVRGTVNEATLPAIVDDETKVALPLIRFTSE